jgi:hypothetical protein
MGIGFFDIAVDQLNISEAQGEIDGDGRLSGSALATGYGEYQGNLLLWQTDLRIIFDS